jgi:hypothetical protein
MFRLNEMKCLFGAILVLGAAMAGAQTLSVTSPNNNDFLGTSNSIKFLVTDIFVEANIKAVATGPQSTTFTSEGDFTPNSDGKIDSSLSLNIQQGSPEGDYQIVVTAKRKDNNVVFGTVTIDVKLDLTKPKFFQFNPLSGTFVKGVVPISAVVLEPNFKDYRVQVNSQDIPNNTGTSLIDDGFTVLWDTTGIQFDGSQSIQIRLRDLANNEENRTINVTLDRVAPSVAIIQPRSDTTVRRRSNISVAVDITDSSTTSVDMTGIDVVARTLGGAYLGRVARQSYRSSGGSTMRWTGRLRYTSSLPTRFKIVVSVVDRAGNVATTQEVIVEYR